MMAAENEISEVEALKLEMQLLKCEVAELRDENSSLKQSVNEAVRNGKPQAAIRSGSIKELQEKLNEKEEQLNQIDRELNMTVQQLYETRKQLSGVQERLTVAEQVTAATQRRELDEEGHSLELPTDHVYEKLRRNLEEEHIYTKLLPIVQKGCYE